MADPSIPDHFTYFFRRGQTPFQSICDLEEAEAEALLKQDTLWRADGTYLAHRKRHEQLLRDLFIAKGGRPRRAHPIYMVLGNSPAGPHDLHLESDFKIVVPISALDPDEVSFTYPDSLYEVPLDNPGRLHLERNERPVVYRLDEMGPVIRAYRVYEFNNHYVEAQVWNDEPLRAYADERFWLPCRADGMGDALTSRLQPAKA